MRVPCWTLYRSVRDRASPAAKTRAAIENALLRIALPHLDPLGLSSFLHHDVDFLSPAHVRDVHGDLRAAVERDVRGPVRTHLHRGLTNSTIFMKSWTNGAAVVIMPSGVPEATRRPSFRTMKRRADM